MPTKVQSKTPGRGGLRQPSPGKKIGRPSTGGREISVRLSPWLITALELKRPETKGDDSQTIKNALLRAILFVKTRPDDPIAKLQPQRSDYGISRSGWHTGITMTNVWFNPELLAGLEGVRLPGETSSHLVRRLLTVSLALQNKIQGAEEPPSRAEYLGLTEVSPESESSDLDEPEEQEIEIPAAQVTRHQSTSRSRVRT